MMMIMAREPRVCEEHVVRQYTLHHTWLVHGPCDLISHLAPPFFSDLTQPPGPTAPPQPDPPGSNTGDILVPLSLLGCGGDDHLHTQHLLVNKSIQRLGMETGCFRSATSCCPLVDKCVNGISPRPALSRHLSTTRKRRVFSSQRQRATSSLQS